MNLYESTVSLLNSSEKSKPEIAKACSVSPRWLSYLASGADRNYSVVLVQRVHDYLNKERSEPDSDKAA